MKIPVILPNKRIERYQELGWTIVVLSYYKHPDMTYWIDDNCDIKRWVHDNIVGEYGAFANVWVFKDKDDAVQFKLRWL